MNNKNRKILHSQIEYLRRLERDLDIEELKTIFDKIEDLKDIEEESFENLKEGLKESEVGMEINENIEIFTESIEIIENLRENIDYLLESIELIREAI